MKFDYPKEGPRSSKRRKKIKTQNNQENQNNPLLQLPPSSSPLCPQKQLSRQIHIPREIVKSNRLQRQSRIIQNQIQHSTALKLQKPNNQQNQQHGQDLQSISQWFQDKQNLQSHLLLHLLQNRLKMCNQDRDLLHLLRLLQSQCRKPVQDQDLL